MNHVKFCIFSLLVIDSLTIFNRHSRRKKENLDFDWEFNFCDVPTAYTVEHDDNPRFRNGLRLA